MSRPAHDALSASCTASTASSSSSSSSATAKRPASPSTIASCDAEHPAQRARRDDDVQTAASSSSSTAAAAACVVSAPRLSLAQTLHTDALLSIFSFTTLRELPLLHRPCRAWHHAASKLHWRRERVDHAALLTLLDSTPLCRRVAWLDITVPITPAELQRVVSSMPRLSIMRVCVSAAGLMQLRAAGREVALVEFTQRAFAGPLLSELTLEIRGEHEPPLWQMLLDAVPSAGSSLTSLRFASRPPVESLDFACLLRLPRLTSFSQDSVLTEQQYLVLKCVHTLRRIRPSEWTRLSLAMLTSPPHQLRDLDLMHLRGMLCGQEHMKQLADLPALTSLRLPRVVSAALPFLRLHPLLRSLRLSFAEKGLMSSGVAGLISGLRACVQLRSLHLEHWKAGMFNFSPGEEMGNILLAAPNLRTLSLRCVHARSLAFLHAAPKLHTLRLEHVRPCMDDSAELLTLGKLTPALRLLRVHASLPLTQAVCDALRPPSTLLLPLLQAFQYRRCEPPAPGDEQSEDERDEEADAQQQEDE